MIQIVFSIYLKVYTTRDISLHMKNYWSIWWKREYWGYKNEYWILHRIQQLFIHLKKTIQRYCNNNSYVHTRNMWWKSYCNATEISHKRSNQVAISCKNYKNLIRNSPFKEPKLINDLKKYSMTGVPPKKNWKFTKWRKQLPAKHQYVTCASPKK